MAFDLAQWRAEVRRSINDFARDPRGELTRAGVETVYGFLLGSTMLPVVAAYAGDPQGTLSTLLGVTGGLGANLVANLVQRKYDDNAIVVVATEAQRADLAPAYAAMVQQVDVVHLAEQALTQVGQITILDQLRDEIRRLATAGPFVGATIVQHQTGGVNFGVGSTIGQIGDIVLDGQASSPQSTTSGAAPSPELEADHLQRLIAQHTQRLQVLEVQSARTGYSAPPEVLTEIDHIRAEIARLRALLNT